MGVDLTGRALIEDFSRGRDTRLLFVFSAVCPYSKKNWPNWTHIISKKPKVEVVYADTTGLSTADFFRQLGVLVPSNVIKTNMLFNQAFNLRATPTTVLLGPGGKVRRVFVGTLDDENMTELLTDLGS